MKILMLSIHSPHFFNWTEQLRDSGHQVYWLDIFDSNTQVEQINFAEQIIGWRYRWDYPGRYYLKQQAPKFTNLVNIFNQRNLRNTFESKVKQIQPDAIHSFILFQACTPIFSFMKNHPEIKWIYSSWGSDLYFHENKGKRGADIKRILPRIDYLFTDCRRDYIIAKRNGFTGDFLGVFPGGGGYEFKKYDKLIQPISKRNTILIKGYEGTHGRCIEVLKSLLLSKKLIKDMNIVVFGANNAVFSYISKYKYLDEKLKVFERIPHYKVMSLMGETLIYIGNSRSDGIPNTLLEAIAQECFPIQSNPGGASSEIIADGENGFLIENPENSEQIAKLLQQALGNPILLKKAIQHNTEMIKPYLERAYIKKLVLEQYKYVEDQLSE